VDLDDEPPEEEEAMDTPQDDEDEEGSQGDLEDKVEEGGQHDLKELDSDAMKRRLAHKVGSLTHLTALLIII